MPRHDYTALTDEQVARIVAEVRPTVEATLRVLGHLPRGGHVRVVDGRLDLPPELLRGWLIRHTLKAAADRAAADTRPPP